MPATVQGNSSDTAANDQLTALTSGFAHIIDFAAPHKRMCDQENSDAIARIIQDISTTVTSPTRRTKSERVGHQTHPLRQFQIPNTMMGSFFFVFQRVLAKATALQRLPKRPKSVSERPASLSERPSPPEGWIQIVYLLQRLADFLRAPRSRVHPKAKSNVHPRGGRAGRRAGRRSMDKGLPPARRPHPSSVFRPCHHIIKRAACPPMGRERTFLQVIGNGQGWGSRKVQVPLAGFSGHRELGRFGPLHQVAISSIHRQPATQALETSVRPSRNAIRGRRLHRRFRVRSVLRYGRDTRRRAPPPR